MEGALGSEVSEHSGIIPRSIHTIFEQLQATKYEDYSVKVSFLELYNEELADLLCEQEERSVSSSMGASSSAKDDGDKKELRIFEDPTGKKGMMVQNLEEVIVESATAVFTLLNKANKNRKVAETNLNARSSRSHYVFTVRHGVIRGGFLRDLFFVSFSAEHAHEFARDAPLPVWSQKQTPAARANVLQ